MHFYHRTKTRAGHGMRVIGGALVEDTDHLKSPPSVETAKFSSNDIAEGSGDVAAEVAREALWSSAWDAIRLSTCFSSSGCDLPLHMCKHMQELYGGGVDAEFRYSRNVKSMLEMIVVLARPRIVVEVSREVDASRQRPRYVAKHIEADATQTGGDGRPMSSSKLTESQLCRGVMSLIRAVRPVDVLSFSSLVTTIADLCFMGCHYVSMPILQTPLPAVPNSSVAVGKDRGILFAPVDEPLRSESGKYLISLMKGKQASPSDDTVPEWCMSVSDEWVAIAVEVVTNKFVSAACSPFLCARLPDLSSWSYLHLYREIATVGELTSAQQTVRPVEKGFLASLARMLTLEDNAESPSKSASDTPVAESNMFRMTPVHVILNPRQSEVQRAAQIWNILPTHMSSFRPFAAILESCLYALRNRRNTPHTKETALSTQQLLLISVACVLSPWKSEELFSDRPFEGDFFSLEVPSLAYHPAWRQDQQKSHPNFEQLTRDYASLALVVFKSISTHLLSSPRLVT